MTVTLKLLSGKHALVTGGGRGIGAAIARDLLVHGARVTILGRSPEALKNTAAELKTFGEVNQVCAEVGDPQAVGQAFEEARNRSGKVAILVNNAGQAASAPFLKTDVKLWRAMLTVNLDGPFHCSQAALPDMLSAGWGRIVNLASIAGLTGHSYVTAYCASKHAVIGLTRSLAVEVAAKGITVNAVCPGYADTGMTRESVANIVQKTGRTAEAALAELVARNPQKRLVKPEEVANAVAWLCLPGSEAVTGQAIVIAGGEVM